MTEKDQNDRDKVRMTGRQSFTLNEKSFYKMSSV